MSRPLRVLIVDDEPPARALLRGYLEAEDGVVVVGEARNGGEAAVATEALEPDLVFLDVQMPEVDGFGYFDLVGVERAPYVVFVTAYDRYALKAFEVHAVGYLLKPFDRDQFRAALERCRELARGRERGGADLTALLAARAPKYAERLLVKQSGRTVLVRTDELDWIEAASNYLKLHRRSQVLLLRETMQRLEVRLDPTRFGRIHRSTIVNLDRIAHLEPYFHGDAIVKLHDGTTLTLSRTYRRRFEARIQKTS
ncbi:MAG: LytR/AlgR family response regulator transcription factor [Gemmatimonadales bacterium]